MIFTPIILGIWLFDRMEELQKTYLYDFEDDKVGSYPDAFVGNLRDTDYTRVVYFDDTYKNVVEVNYWQEPPYNPLEYGGMEFNTLYGLTLSGIIEFDIYLLSYKKVNIDICQSDPIYDSDDDITINFQADRSIVIKDENKNYKQISLFSIRKWYHFKIEYNVDEWKIWVNGKLEQTNIKYYLEPPYFCQLYFATYDLGQVFYVDNIKIIMLETI